MKAIVFIKSLSRGEKGDTLKFVQDDTGTLPPLIQQRGGAKDGQQSTAKALRWEPEAGKISIRDSGQDGNILEGVEGVLQRTDAWETDKDSGEIDSSASITFTVETRFGSEVIAALFEAKALALTFTPSQQQIDFAGKSKQKAA